MRKNNTRDHLTTGFLLVRVLVSSIFDLCIWKEGTTHCPQEHCSPAQLKEPSRALHFGQRIYNNKIIKDVHHKQMYDLFIDYYCSKYGVNIPRTI